MLLRTQGIQPSTLHKIPFKRASPDMGFLHSFPCVQQMTAFLTKAIVRWPFHGPGPPRPNLSTKPNCLDVRAMAGWG